MAVAAGASEHKSVIPRPSGRPVAPTPLRVGAPAEKAGMLVGVAPPPKSEPAPATARVPEAPPSSRASLDAKPLLPARTPNRIAIVQGASISAAMRAAPVATMQPQTPAIPPPPAPVAAPIAFDKTLALANAAPRPSTPPAHPSSRPSGGAFGAVGAPAAGPHASPGPRFDRRSRWSTPQLATPLPVTRTIPPEPVSEEPLTYQVYTPSTIASTPMPSMRSGSMVIPPPKASVGARVCMALVGVCVVLGTAVIVTLGTEEHASKAAATNAVAVMPVDPPPPAPIAPPATIDAPAAPPQPAIAAPGTIVKTKTKGPPRSIKNAKPPPNPYDGATAKR